MELNRPVPVVVNEIVPVGEMPVTETDTVDDPPTVIDVGLSDMDSEDVVCVTVSTALLELATLFASPE